MKLPQFYVTTFLVRGACWISIAVFADMHIFGWFLLFFCKFYLYDMKIDKTNTEIMLITC